MSLETVFKDLGQMQFYAYAYFIYSNKCGDGYLRKNTG